MALKILWASVIASLANGVAGHGYLTFPTARRLAQKQSMYTGITAFGGGQHITNCGKDGLSTPSTQDVVTDLQRSSIMKFDITIDAHHAGHLEMRLCPFIVDGDDQDISSCTSLHRATAEEAGISDCQASDGRDICAAVDPNNPTWWYLAPKGPQGNLHSMWYHIPSNVNCPNNRCTVQFTWKTANSCNPHPAAYCNYYHDVPGPQNSWCNNYYCGAFCDQLKNGWATAPEDACQATMGDRLCCSEVFTNCAEVRLLGDGETSPPTPAPTRRRQTVASTTATPGNGGDNSNGATGDSCVQNDDCAANAWCNDATYITWCPNHPVDNCPTPQCKVGGATSPESEPEPEAEPEPEVDPAPAPPPAPSNGGGAIGSHNACDDGSASSCKGQCSQKCGHAVGTNQCWGTPRYVECKCTDGTTHAFDGCACEHSTCGSSAALVEQAFAAHKKKVRKHRFMAGDHMMIQGYKGKLGKQAKKLVDVGVDNEEL